MDLKGYRLEDYDIVVAFNRVMTVKIDRKYILKVQLTRC